jgi:isocitrate dehydrogenase
MSLAEIAWTKTDEAPLLATYSFYPIVKGFIKSSGISISLKDISVAGRVIALFPELLKPEQRIPDVLHELGELAKTPQANTIKLPNISASIPQLKECIAELQAKGFKIPDYPEKPSSDAEKAIHAKYSTVLGSAVNPVLREGNSDRRAAAPVKNYAKKYPHKMGSWDPNSKTHVAHMSEGDFFAHEKSTTLSQNDAYRVEHVDASGKVTVLKKGIKLTKGEVLDATFMSVRELSKFYDKEIQDCKAQGLLLSLHLKATMMKVSDPIMFGHCVKVFFKELFAKHGAVFQELGVNPNNGFGDVLSKIEKLPAAKKAEILADIDACYASQPQLAMVSSDDGITNLHVPSDVIIDASMPAMIRGQDGLGGGMWCPDSKPGAKDSHLRDTKALIPDRCYAGVFKETIEFCKKHGAFDPTTMGSVPNVGLMALKAEEYGSHPTTFEAPANGTMRCVADSGAVLLEHQVEAGDIWRSCQTKDIAIKDWVKLAVTRARASGWPAIFWLDKNRAHDAQIIAKVNTYLPEHDTTGLDLSILPPTMACGKSLERAKNGESTISVTGNVLRDYNTDLFPIIELGTSAKMLSIVPLLAGGGMYETGAGGSAPKHVQQFQKEGHLRWDSLGEFLALAVSLEEISVKTGSQKVAALAAGLNAANDRFLDANKNPSRKVKEIDTRGSHFYVALYWAQALAACNDPELKALFTQVADVLTQNEAKIADELIQCQGSPVDIGGYYQLDDAKAFAAMRPSATLNAVIDRLEQGTPASRL